MKKTYISPNYKIIEMTITDSMLVTLSKTEAASDAEVYGRETNFWDEKE